VLFAQPKHTKAEHGRLFPAVHVLMARLLGHGVSVIVDATNLKESNRRPYYKLAEEHGAKVLLVRTWASRREIRRRLIARESRPNAADRSTATLEVYEAMLADVERIPRRHINVNTTMDLEPAVDKILSNLSAS
jgi:predicted kinase